MTMFKTVSVRIISGILCCAVAGCSCVSFTPSTGVTVENQLQTAVQYRIDNSEIITLNQLNNDVHLSSLELQMLNYSTNNQQGNDFEAYWNKITPQIYSASGTQSKVSSNTVSLSIFTRTLAPTVFNNLPEAVPVKVKTVVSIRPSTISPWWMTAYLLSVTMAPMSRYSNGVAVVAVLDKNGRTIGTQSIVLERSFWFSGLFPTALFGGGRFSASQGISEGEEINDKPLIDEIISQSVVNILYTNSLPHPPKVKDSRWSNIRSAIIESVATGNNQSAISLLKDAAKNNIGGHECGSFLDILD